MEINVDVEKLRDDLVDYFGSATPMYPIALADVVHIQSASPSEVINTAIKNGFDLRDYEDYSLSR